MSWVAAGTERRQRINFKSLYIELHLRDQIRRFLDECDALNWTRIVEHKRIICAP